MKWIKKFESFDNSDVDYLTQLFSELQDEGIEYEILPSYFGTKINFFPKQVEIDIYAIKEKFEQVLSVLPECEIKNIIIFANTNDLHSGDFVPGFSEKVLNKFQFSSFNDFSIKKCLIESFYYDVLETGMNVWMPDLVYKGKNKSGDHVFIKYIQFEEPIELEVSESDLETDVRMSIVCLTVQLSK